jgi:hypothetical protein
MKENQLKKDLNLTVILLKTNNIIMILLKFIKK